eukprot:scaffold101196_cov25-Prasinocladus_malaysianus.AAC.1
MAPAYSIPQKHRWNSVICHAEPGCRLYRGDQCNFKHHSAVGETDKSVDATNIPPRTHSATATRNKSYL